MYLQLVWHTSCDDTFKVASLCESGWNRRFACHSDINIKVIQQFMPAPERLRCELKAFMFNASPLSRYLANSCAINFAVWCSETDQRLINSWAQRICHSKLIAISWQSFNYAFQAAFWSKPSTSNENLKLNQKAFYFFMLHYLHYTWIYAVKLKFICKSLNFICLR